MFLGCQSNGSMSYGHFWMRCPDGCTCCFFGVSDIPCYVSPDCCWVKIWRWKYILKIGFISQIDMSLSSVMSIRIYSKASIAENPLLAVRAFSVNFYLRLSNEFVKWQHIKSGFVLSGSFEFLNDNFSKSLIELWLSLWNNASIFWTLIVLNA